MALFLAITQLFLDILSWELGVAKSNRYNILKDIQDLKLTLNVNLSKCYNSAIFGHTQQIIDIVVPENSLYLILNANYKFKMATTANFKWL